MMLEQNKTNLVQNIIDTLRKAHKMGQANANSEWKNFEMLINKIPPRQKMFMGGIIGYGLGRLSFAYVEGIYDSLKNKSL